MCYKVSTPTKRSLKNEHKDGFRIDEAGTAHNIGYDHPNLAATILAEQEQAQAMQWGLIGKRATTAKEARKIQDTTLFARAEEIFETPSYKDLIMTHRCLIWVDGFYERQHDNGLIIPHYLEMIDGSQISFGGLWNYWENPETAEVISSCTIITTAANKLLTEVHNKNPRMPLIIPTDRRDEWLNTGTTERRIKSLMVPLPDGLLRAISLVEKPPTLF